MKDRTSILKLIKTSVMNTEPDAVLILYGSYARGDNKEDSDMDILVLVNKDTVSRDDQRRIKYFEWSKHSRCFIIKDCKTLLVVEFLHKIIMVSLFFGSIMVLRPR